MAFSDTPHIVRLVEAVERHGHRDVRLQIEVKHGGSSVGVARVTKNGEKHITGTHLGAGTRDINEMALDVLEDLAVQALMQVGSYKDPYELERRK